MLSLLLAKKRQQVHLFLRKSLRVAGAQSVGQLSLSVTLGAQLFDGFFVNVVQLRQTGAATLALHVDDLVQIGLRDRLDQRNNLRGILADHRYGDDLGAFLKVNFQLLGKPGERLGLFVHHLQILDFLPLKGGAENEVVLDPGRLGPLVSEEFAAPFGRIGVANHQPRRGHRDPELRISRIADRKQKPGRGADGPRHQQAQKSRQQPAPAQGLQQQGQVGASRQGRRRSQVSRPRKSRARFHQLSLAAAGRQGFFRTV